MSGDGVSAMRALVARLGDQLRESWTATGSLDLRRDVAHRRLVVCGMGGSAAAGEIVAGSFAGTDFEVVVHRGYDLPTPLGAGDVVVLSSYSGHTEETLSCLDEVCARESGATLLVMSSGGELSARGHARGLPVLTIPGGLPPRASLGHGVGTLCAVLHAMRVPGMEAQVDAAVDRLRRGVRRFGLDGQAPEDDSVTRLAEVLRGRLPVVYAGSRPAIAAARRLRAQLNENAKVLASVAELPELDHNEIVGWSAATAYRAEAVVLALRDPQEHPRVARRFTITREVLADRVPAWTEWTCAEGPTLARAMELVQAGDALTVALADLTGIDPMPVEPIDVLKRRLAD